MALVNMCEMLTKAKEGKYAVGQFNINNLEWTKTILETAQEQNSPVILGVSEGAAKYMGGFKTVVGMVKGLIEELNITVSVAIHLDHGQSFENCKKAIDAGFTSVMIDGSHHPIDENIKMTKEVVEYAHAKGESVEAEVGTVGGNEWSWAELTATSSPIGSSQMIGNKIEIQIVREYIPATWNESGFTIGFDIQQKWNSVGILPNATSGGKTNKLPVVIDWENHADQPLQPENPTVETTVTYTSTDALFPNPERGFLKQIYYTSQQLNSVQTANTVRKNREDENVTLYLDNYFMMDYISSDISQAFLNRMENNFKALRAGGGKAVIRYSYKYSDTEADKPWDAEPKWMLRHIEQLKPYWQEYADVILCLEAGFIGVWGEWYYTTNFPFNPTKDSEFEPRWTIVNELLEALPVDRQIALRTPAFKMRYLDMHGEEVAPLTAEEAYQNTANKSDRFGRTR